MINCLLMGWQNEGERVKRRIEERRKWVKRREEEGKGRGSMCMIIDNDGE